MLVLGTSSHVASKCMKPYKEVHVNKGKPLGNQVEQITSPACDDGIMNPTLMYNYKAPIKKTEVQVHQNQGPGWLRVLQCEWATWWVTLGPSLISARREMSQVCESQPNHRSVSEAKDCGLLLSEASSLGVVCYLVADNQGPFLNQACLSVSQMQDGADSNGKPRLGRAAFKLLSWVLLSSMAS